MFFALIAEQINSNQGVLKTCAILLFGVFKETYLVFQSKTRRYFFKSLFSN